MTARLQSPAARVAHVRYMGRARRVNALLAESAAARAELERSRERLAVIRAQIAEILGRQP